MEWHRIISPPVFSALKRATRVIYLAQDASQAKEVNPLPAKKQTLKTLQVSELTFGLFCSSWSFKSYRGSVLLSFPLGRTVWTGILKDSKWELYQWKCGKSKNWGAVISIWGEYSVFLRICDSVHISLSLFWGSFNHKEEAGHGEWQAAQWSMVAGQ